jgi:hypothetical protein
MVFTCACVLPSIKVTGRGGMSGLGMAETICVRDWRSVWAKATTDTKLNTEDLQQRRESASEREIFKKQTARQEG